MTDRPTEDSSPMTMTIRPITGIALAGLTWAMIAAQAPPPAGFRPVPTEELMEELKSAPRENPARQDRLRELYLQAGARHEDVTLQPVKLPEEAEATLNNVIVTKKGKTDAVIVVGGHLDKVRQGDGVIDDWSGACMATNLYQTIRDVETTHTFVFMGFAHEERGLVGSRQYVQTLAEDVRPRIKAMVNLECLGPDEAHLWTNGSTDELEDLARAVAREVGLPLKEHVLMGVGADSIPFEKAGIPNITFDGLPREKFRLIHSDEDTFENVDPGCYERSFRLVARFLLRLDRGIPEVKPTPKPADPGP